jgi:CshA-type fibril repeat protein
MRSAAVAALLCPLLLTTGPALAETVGGAVDDVSRDGAGQVQTVDPLANDTAEDPGVDLDPATLELLDADGLPADQVTVAGGSYTIESGRIAFAPGPRFAGTATPVQYRVADARGAELTARYTPTVTDVASAARPAAAGVSASVDHTADPDDDADAAAPARAHTVNAAALAPRDDPNDGSTGIQLLPDRASASGPNGVEVLPGTGAGEADAPIGVLGLLMLAAGLLITGRRVSGPWSSGGRRVRGPAHRGARQGAAHAR